MHGRAGQPRLLTGRPLLPPPHRPVQTVGQPSLSLGRGHRVPHPVITKGMFITHVLSDERRLPGKGTYHIRKAFATGCAVATRPADECTGESRLAGAEWPAGAAVDAGV